MRITDLLDARSIDKAAKADGITGEVLLQNLECRLDNVVFRLGKHNSATESAPPLKAMITLSVGIKSRF